MDSGAVTCCSLQPGVAIQESEDLNMLEDWLQLRPLPVSSQKPYMEQILALDRLPVGRRGLLLQEQQQLGPTVNMDGATLERDIKHKGDLPILNPKLVSVPANMAALSSQSQGRPGG